MLCLIVFHHRFQLLSMGLLSGLVRTGSRLHPPHLILTYLTANTAAVTAVADLCAVMRWDASSHVCNGNVCSQCTPQHLCMLMQLSTSDELEGKFAQLEGDDVDTELSAMKKGLLGKGGSSKAKQSLPEGRSEGRPYK